MVKLWHFFFFFLIAMPPFIHLSVLLQELRVEVVGRAWRYDVVSR